MRGDLEHHTLGLADFELLRSWGFNPWAHPLPAEARKMVLVGRLQRKLGVTPVDGRYGPHTNAAYLRRSPNERPHVGPELGLICATYLLERLCTRHIHDYTYTHIE